MQNEQPIVKLTGISKSYAQYASPRDRFIEIFAGTRKHKVFHALSQVDLELFRGQSLGLLGRNGAGKSTIMQIIARTVTPTNGRVEVNGRVSPLLELGTGFNPDYTGRENLRLNAAILGLSQAEIAEREQSIIDFADIGHFIDEAVKTYSSGMFARLAFSVAIHVDPDILLIDEILSVGDAVFQQKCLAMLKSLRDRGVSIIFVSHSADVVKSICDSAIFLDKGSVRQVGPADEVADAYMSFLREEANVQQAKLEARAGTINTKEWKYSLPNQFRYGSGDMQVFKVEVLDVDGAPKTIFEFGENVLVRVYAKSFIAADHTSVSIVINDGAGTDIFGTTSFDERIEIPAVTADEEFAVDFRFPIYVRKGNYGVSVSLNRVSDRAYLDNFLYDALRGTSAFSVAEDLNRPIHYKVHVPFAIRILRGP